MAEENQGQASQTNERSEEDLQADMEALKSDLRKVQSDLQQVAQSMVGWGRQSYEQARQQAGSQMENGMEQVETYVRERPIATVLTAFGIGMVAGILFRR